jgi:hypothetical protein
VRGAAALTAALQRCEIPCFSKGGKEDTMKYLWMIIMALSAFLVLNPGNLVYADDLDDGISKYSDESISGDADMGQADTNINFIVLDALAEAKKRQKSGNENANFNDGSGDSNQNSVVVGPGSDVKEIYNINLGQ